jgi:hypothetical protein
MPLLQRTFPRTRITTDTERDPDLIVRSHFQRMEPTRPYSCPYITWSGESYPVAHLPDGPPLLELNTAHTGRPNEIWFPHIVAELEKTSRPDPVVWPKRWCCAMAFTNRVREREELFWQMRIQEPTCYGFGRSCHTPDCPFELPAANRGQNGRAFQDFGFIVAMENKVAPGYLTEKIGYAFSAGAVPIYWGDSATVSDFFNPAAFINVLDHASPRAAADYAVQIWRDPHKLRAYLDAPLTLNHRLEDYEAVRTDYRPWQAPFIDKLREAFPDQ